MKIVSFLPAIVCLLSAVLIQAQVPNTSTPSTGTSVEQPGNTAFWQAKFDNGGHYMVRLGNVSSVSRHEYIANAAARVTEVTIATNGAVVARFYWLEAMTNDTTVAAASVVTNRLTDLATGAAQKVSPSAGKIQVVKDYPQTTHAHTVEYALQKKEVLESLFKSLTEAVESNRGRIWNESEGGGK